MNGMNNNNFNLMNNNFNNFQNQNMNMNNQYNNFNQMNNYINNPNNNMNMSMNINNNQNNILNNNYMNHSFNNFFLNQFNNMNLNQNYLQNNNLNQINIDKNKTDEEEKNIEDSLWMSYNIEKELLNHTDNINTTMDGNKIIHHQMKNCLCYINNCYNGFLCYIPYGGEKIPVLITKSSFIYFPQNETIINISMDEGKFKYNLQVNKNNILYNNEKYNIIIIKISQNDKFNNNNFMELDDNLLNDDYQLIKKINHYMFFTIIKMEKH